MLFLASIVELVNDVLIFSVGILLIQTGCGKPRQAAVRGLLSPGLVGVAMGFVLFLTGWKLPAFVGEALSMAAEATAPSFLQNRCTSHDLLCRGAKFVLQIFQTSAP